MFLEETTKISISPQGTLCPDLHIPLTSVQVAPAVLLVLNPWPAQGEVMLTFPTVWNSNSADICMTFRVYLWTGAHSTETELPFINPPFIFLYNIHLHLMNLQVCIYFLCKYWNFVFFVYQYSPRPRIGKTHSGCSVCICAINNCVVYSCLCECMYTHTHTHTPICLFLQWILVPIFQWLVLHILTKNRLLELRPQVF